MDPKYKNILKQFLKFALIGGFNTLLDLGILNILSRITGIVSGNGIIPLNFISFSIATVNSYFLNKKFSFQDTNSSEGGRKFMLFLIVSIIGVTINTTVVKVVSTNIDPMFGLSPAMWLNVAKLAATGVSLVWNFIGYKIFVFKK